MVPCCPLDLDFGDALAASFLSVLQAPSSGFSDPKARRGWENVKDLHRKAVGLHLRVAAGIGGGVFDGGQMRMRVAVD